MLGALLELRRAVWAPVGARGQIRGVVLAGTRRKRGVLPVAHVEAISAELALAIELEEERQLARQRQADMNALGRFLSELASSGPIDSIFTRLVDGCTETAPGGDGLGAVFAILRTYPEVDLKTATPTHQSLWSSARPDTNACAGRCWKSGDAAWLHAMDSSPLASIWQRAETARDPIVITSSSGLPWPRADVSRIVAIPLMASRESVGTLIAGLRPVPIAHRDVERLERRGELAAAALAHRRCTSWLSLERKRQHSILASDLAAKIIVDATGRLGAMSRGAQELLGQVESPANLAEQSAASRQPRFSELFEAPDQQDVEAWLQRVQSLPRTSRSLDDESHEAHLRNGAAVRLRPIPLSDAAVAPLRPRVLLESRPTSTASTPPAHAAAKRSCTVSSNGSKKASCYSTCTTKFKR